MPVGTGATFVTPARSQPTYIQRSAAGGPAPAEVDDAPQALPGGALACAAGEFAPAEVDDAPQASPGGALAFAVERLSEGAPGAPTVVVDAPAGDDVVQDEASGASHGRRGGRLRSAGGWCIASRRSHPDVVSLGHRAVLSP